MNLSEKTRDTERKMMQVFSAQKPFSEHLLKWEDPALPDKYDFNYFEYSAQPGKDEFLAALSYQKKLGADFLKLEGNEPLQDSFGLEGCVTLTMVLEGQGTFVKTNEALSFRTPTPEELEEIEVKHYGSLYGEDFCRRNIRRQYGKLEYYGAFLDDGLVGACYGFRCDGIVCIDGLIVDQDYRHQYTATSLICHIRELYEKDMMMLHAEEDDTPKEMYRKMGFTITDRQYEYLRTDLQCCEYEQILF